MGAQLPSSTSHGGRGRRTRAPMAEINVTPFVDVMLVLLIIFMVTAPLLVAGVQVDLPESRANALEQDKEPIQISLEASGQVYIGDEPVSPADLPQRLAEIRDQAMIGADGQPLQGEAASQAMPQIMLRADKALDYGLVMAVMGELNRAGLNKLSLVTTGSAEEQ